MHGWRTRLGVALENRLFYHLAPYHRPFFSYREYFLLDPTSNKPPSFLLAEETNDTGIFVSARHSLESLNRQRQPAVGEGLLLSTATTIITIIFIIIIIIIIITSLECLISVIILLLLPQATEPMLMR